MFGDKITQSVSEAVKKVLATEKLHPNQQKLDVHEPEKNKLTKKDFEMLRSNNKPKNEAFNPLKHIVNPSPAVKTAAKDVKRGSYADRAALMKAGGVKDDRGPRGVTQEDLEKIDELSKTTLGSYIKKAANDKLSNENTAEAINLVKGAIEGITSNPFLGKSPSGNHSETDVSKLPEIEVIPGETDIGHHAVCYESFIETVGAKKPRGSQVFFMTFFYYSLQKNTGCLVAQYQPIESWHI